MKTAWTWSQDGQVTVSAGGRTETFKLLPAKPEEVMEYATELEAAKRVQFTLSAAHLSFQQGRADYAEAVRNLRDLFTEFDEAKMQTETHLMKAAAFLEPPTAAELFSDVRDLDRFVTELIVRVTSKG